jgi:sugar/nucleoside kinase (ribokinase family)
VISTEPQHMRARVLPCLPHLDSLVINDYEAAALTGLAVCRASGPTPPRRCRPPAVVVCRGENGVVSAQ